MKKSLLILASAMLATLGASAIEPTEYPGYVLTGISPNGEWAVSSDEYTYSFSILNLKTDRVWDYGMDYDDEYVFSAGVGHYISDNGVVVATGFVDGLGYYWSDGVWQVLPIAETDFGAYPEAITPDGSRITGSVARTAMSLEAEDIMNVPVVWNRNADGGYDMYEVVNYPEVDFTGRTPQYILVNDISADGTVLAGDLVDYAGFAQQPIVFTQKADGEWTYTIPNPELINPEGLEFPEFPGDAPQAPNPEDFMSDAQRAAYEQAVEEYESRPEPEQTDFMTPEELDAYEAAWEAYYEDWENNPFPFIGDYMTEEEMAAYDEAYNEYWSTPRPDPAEYLTFSGLQQYMAAYSAYSAAYDQWEEAYYAFDDIYNEVLADPATLAFSMNSARISPNGRYYVMSAEQVVENPDSWFGYDVVMTPCLFDLDKGTATLMDKGRTDVYANMVTDEAYVLGASPSNDYTRNAYLAQGADAPFVALLDLIKAKDAALGEWIEDTMTQTVITEVETYNPETDEYEYDYVETEQCMLGTPTANADLSVFVTWNYNNWDEMSGEWFYSYLLPLQGKLSGVESVSSKSSTLGLTVGRDGVITIDGAASAIAVYDVNGREVFSLDAPGAQVVTRLAKGAYIVKATAADGTTVICKAVF